MTGVKICGLTTPETLEAALAGGAAFVGAVMFARSPRNIAPTDAATLFERARGRAKIVAVVVDADDALLRDITATLRPDFIQMHGHETPERAEQVRAFTGAGIIKALPIRTPEDFAPAAVWEPFVDHLMFDAKPAPDAAMPGGVGASFDWSLPADHQDRHGRFRAPWFLAGGLNPGNAASAATISGAPLLDVSSGVESAPGVKDTALITAFLKAVQP